MSVKYITYSQESSYDVALLIKDGAFRKSELKTHYVEPLEKLGIDSSRIVGFNLEHQGKKCSVKLARQHLAELVPMLIETGVKYICVCDPVYFKLLTNMKKVESHYGYILDCTMEGLEDVKVTICTNYQGLFYNPDLQQKIDLSLKTLSDSINDSYSPIGQDIIHSAYYPIPSVTEVTKALNSLHQYDTLTCDIETFSLKFWEAGIGTIGFSWDQHNGIAFPVDYKLRLVPTMIDEVMHYGKQVHNAALKKCLLQFFLNYKGTIIYHNGSFDIKVLIYELFMDDLLDQEGMIEGIKVLGKNIHDTKLITYLATNSTAGNTLGLKPNAHEFAGNYAENDINDIRRIPLPALLQYNLVDCLSTFYVFNKNYPIMVQDEQLEIYNTIKIPSVRVLLQIELTGMPLDMARVLEVEKELQDIYNSWDKTLRTLPIIKDFIKYLRQQESDKAHAKWKKKTAPIEHFDYVDYNPGSNPQTQALLYDYLGYDVIDLTQSKQPAVGAKTLKKLRHVSKGDDHTDMFDALIGLAKAGKILSTFITAFKENSVLKGDGLYYLHGSFNIGGTVSGRLSSSQPNLQTIPSGSTYAKLIKSCFRAPDGWLMVGCDFASLEDRISALTTKDPNKLKVYIEGYDGHSLRAFGYFGDQMPDIDPNCVKSINSIEDAYPELRQESKAPTFAFTYQGTWHTCVSNLGWSKEKSQAVEKSYHEMYHVSDEWVQQKLVEATDVGYLTVAFGLRVRTPVLAQCVLNTSSTPYEAQAESRTAGNALGQSYCMLNNRAGIEFQERTFASDEALNIRPIAHIHDAQYFIIRNDITTLRWLNKNLVECMQWQELPEIQHDIVKLGGDLELYYPTWKDMYRIPNNASEEEIFKITEG